ncbi:hypothetical protein ACA910_009851 [Epithemia clementina (nom. ined.)]
MATMNQDDDKKKRLPTVLPLWSVAFILTLQICVLAFLLLFFRHVQIVLVPRRLPPIEFHKKEHSTGKMFFSFLDPWEIVVCLATMAAIAILRGSLHRILHAALVNKRKTLTILVSVLSLISFVWMIWLQRLVFPPPCQGWIRTDVGFVQGHDRYGHNMHALCHGKIWEPHVATAIEDYLYGQGRAIDVGAFVGYHTLRLAKRAAPFAVYAIEGRLGKELDGNLKRNNAKNVHVLSVTIDKNWQLSPDMQQDWMDPVKGPLAFVKVDCEGCELHFLKAAKTVLLEWHPAMVIEIQDDESRASVALGGQQMIKPAGTRKEVLDFLKKELGYTVTPLLDELDGQVTWDYLALWLQ